MLTFKKLLLIPFFFFIASAHSDPAPISKKSNWIKYGTLNMSAVETYSIELFYDANSIKKNGSIVSLMTLDKYSKGQNGFKKNKDMYFYDLQENIIKVDCKHKTVQKLREIYLANISGVETVLDYQDTDPSWTAFQPVSSWADLASKVCK